MMTYLATHETPNGKLNTELPYIARFIADTRCGVSLLPASALQGYINR
jgi:hypothetical protein